MKIHSHLPNATDDLPRLDAEQEEAIQLMLAEPTHAVCNASTMSAGKTVITSEWIIRSGVQRVLIIGVKDTAKQWAAALSDQSDGEIQLRRIDGTKAGRSNLASMLSGESGVFFSGSQFLTTQDWEHRDKLDADGEPIPEVDRKSGELTGKNVRERVHKRIFKKMKTQLDALVVDEIHIMAANRKNVGRRTLISIPTDWKVALSGTFYGNKFENAWSVTRWLWPSLIDASFHRWKAVWCALGEPTYVRRNGKLEEIEEIENIAGEKEPGRFVASLPCYFRIEAAEAPPAPKMVFVDLSAPQREQYRAMEKDMLVWLRERHPGASEQDLVPLVAELPIAMRQRLRTATLGEMSLDGNGEVQFDLDAASTKLDALSGILGHYRMKDPVDAQRKVVIYTDSKRAAKVAVARMQRAGLSVAEWSGDVPSKKRDDIKTSFLRPLSEGGLQYIVAVISAFGTGLDGFQRVCSTIVSLSEIEGDAVQNLQAVHRIWRRGVDRDAYEHVMIVARDTLDEGVFGGLRARESSMLTTMRAA